MSLHNTRNRAVHLKHMGWLHCPTANSDEWSMQMLQVSFKLVKVKTEEASESDEYEEDDEWETHEMVALRTANNGDSSVSHLKESRAIIYSG